MKSKETKKYQICYHIFSFLSFVLTLGPIFYYIITGYIESDLTKEKVALTCTVMCSLVFVVLNLLMKYNIRSTVWILLLGIYYAVDNIMPLLLMIAFGTIADEFLISPLKKTFKNKYSINKEIDKRI